MSHHASKLDNGNYIVLREVSVGTSGTTGTRVEELTPDNQIAWSWNLADHVDPSNATGDWCHGNSATIDLVEDTLYLSCRFLGVFKANRTGDQAVLWHMAGTYGDLQGDMGFIPWPR